MLPLVLKRFPEADVAVWFVFSAVLAVQGVLGLGFGPSFARLLSYARAGASVEDMRDLRDLRGITRASGTNWESIGRLFACMRAVFRGLGWSSLVLLGTLGTLCVWRPIAHTGHRWDVWAAWAVLVVGSSITFWNTLYASYLQGMDQQVQWRRLETGVSLVTILLAFLVLLAGGGLLALVVSNQLCAAVSTLFFCRLCRRLSGERFQDWSRLPADRTTFLITWGSAWKTGLTNVLTYGLAQATGIVQAQIASPADVATYNLHLRLATMLQQVVQAPFITKLPELARLRALGDLPGQVALLQRGMRLTLWLIIAAGVGTALALPTLLQLIGTKSVQFNFLLWALFAANMLLERHGGMLHQIRNLTNAPLEHFATGGYALLSLALMAGFLHGGLGYYSFPLAWLGTQMLFAEWYAARIAYPVIGSSFLRFESTVFIPPFVTMLGLVLLSWLLPK